MSTLPHLLPRIIVRRARLKRIKQRETAYFSLKFIKAMDPEKRSTCIDRLES